MTRSVAEIIGFSAPHNFHHEGGDAWRCVACGDLESSRFTPPACPRGARPTVDDLLAWLREQGWVASILTWSDITDVRVDIHTNYRLDHHELHAPTLLGALEQAVRAVAGES